MRRGRGSGCDGGVEWGCGAVQLRRDWNACPLEPAARLRRCNAVFPADAFRGVVLAEESAKPYTDFR